MNRRDRGEFVVELPLVLLVLFLILFFPLLNLGTATLRAYFIRTACLEAVRSSARCQSFVADIPANVTTGDPKSLSATTTLTDRLNLFASQGFLGHSTLNVPPAGGAVFLVVRVGYDGSNTEYKQPLKPQDIDTSKYTYFYELRTTGQAGPFFRIPGPCLATSRD
jgi:hypothetical protein